LHALTSTLHPTLCVHLLCIKVVHGSGYSTTEVYLR
jgi:hypothetical protein